MKLVKLAAVAVVVGLALCGCTPKLGPDTAKEAKGPRLLSVSWCGQDKICFTASGLDKWPRKDDDGDGQKVYAVLQINGKGVDDVADGRTWASTRNIHGSGRHGQKIAKGATVKVRFARFDNSEFTNELELKWQ